MDVDRMAAQLHSPSLWFDHYQGAVYPLDLDDEPQYGGSRRLKSLVSICCHHIVGDSTATLQATSLLPQPLIVPLMQEALLRNNDRAVEVLLWHWPYPKLVLRDLLPHPFTSLLPLYNQNYQAELVRQGMRFTTTVAHTLMEALKKRKSTLRYLDMTGFPSAELMLLYISSHCLLVFNEMRQDCMVDLYNKSLEAGRMDKKEELEKIQHSFPENHHFYVRMDAFVTSDGTLRELCRALKVSKFENSRMQLCLSKLSVTCLGEPSLNILLSLVDPQYLTGLQVKYNALSCEDIISLAPLLKCLHNLTSLDLSCNKIHIWSNDAACVELADILSHLPNLSRLDLSNNRLKTKLRRVIEPIPHPLKYLRLSACRLTVNDFLYLAISHHLQALEELDLGDNFLTLSIESLCKVLSGTQSTLRVLELEDCALTDRDLLLLQEPLSRMSKLLYLNAANNSISSETLMQFTRVVSSLSRLKVFKTSYPVECYRDFVREENEDIRKAESVSQIDKILSSSQSVVGSERIQLIAVELEHVLES